MVAYKSERDDTNRLRNPLINDEASPQLPSQLKRNEETLRDDGDNDDEHADQSQCRCFGELGDIAIHAQWERDPEDKKHDDGAAICEEPEKRRVGEGWKDGAKDGRDSVADYYAEGEHAAESTTDTHDQYMISGIWKHG